MALWDDALSWLTQDGQPFRSGNPTLDAMMQARELPDPTVTPTLGLREQEPWTQSVAGIGNAVLPYMLGAAPANSISSGIRAYHGSPADFAAFDPAMAKSGYYGKGTYFHEAEADALKHKFSVDAPAGGKMYEADLNTQRPFDMSKPVSADDAASVLDALGNSELAAKVRQSGQGYRTGSEFWYWGARDASPDAKAAAIRKAGFDAITGANPRLENTGATNYSNIVNVLDPSIIDILKKYGIPAGLLGTGAAAGASQDGT